MLRCATDLLMNAFLGGQGSGFADPVGAGRKGGFLELFPLALVAIYCERQFGTEDWIDNTGIRVDFTMLLLFTASCLPLHCLQVHYI